MKVDLERLQKLKRKKNRRKGWKKKDSRQERMLLVWKRNKYISSRREPLLHHFLFENQVYFSGGLG